MAGWWLCSQLLHVPKGCACATSLPGCAGLRSAAPGAAGWHRSGWGY